MYCLLFILSMWSSQELNWYLRLTLSLQTQRKAETLHSKCPASDCRLNQTKQVSLCLCLKLFIRDTVKMLALTLLRVKCNVASLVVMWIFYKQ